MPPFIVLIGNVIRGAARFLSSYAAVIFFIYLGELAAAEPALKFFTSSAHTATWLFRMCAAIVYCGMLLEALSDSGMKPAREGFRDILTIGFFSALTPFLWITIKQLAQVQVQP